MRTSRSTALVVLGAWTLLVLVVLLNSAGSQAIDIKPELYLAPWRMAGFFASPWQQSPQLGWSSFNVGLVPVPAAIAGLQALGLTPILSMRVLRILLYTVGAWGMLRLHRAMTAEGGTPTSRTVAALAYVANPYAVVGGSTLAVLLPYALLPWQSLFLVRALRSGRPGRDVAAFGLCFAAMSGMNAGVIPLLQLVTVPFLVWWVHADSRVALRHLVRVTASCAATVVLVSLYWLVPSVVGSGQGVAVLENSETVEGINGTSSLAEVLRGLGFWGMYGQNQRGPYQPGFVDYLTSGPVVVLTLLVPAAIGVAALVARGAVRVVSLSLLVVAAFLMVGVYPPAHPSPLGRGLRWMFDHVAVTGAFRTLNKLGAVLVLAAVLLVAGAVATSRSSGTWTGRRGAAGRAAALLAALALGIAGVFPALVGGLYPRVLDVPAYWHQAADALNEGPQDSRVWFVPGAVQPHYRWATDQPDDLALPLITGPSLVRTTLPVASPYAANFLAQLDTETHENTLYAGSVSAAARYLGVRDVLLRNDVVWEDYFGARPATLQGTIGPDTGLQLAGQYGSPGDGTTAPNDTSPQAAIERQLPPLQDWSVTGHRPVVRAESLQGMVVVAGDGAAFSPLVASGLLANGQSFRYAGDLDPGELAGLLGPDRRLVLTDTNRRRTSVLGRLAGNLGPLLPATADAGSSRTLFGAPDQTVLSVSGGAHVFASQVGSTFGVLAEAVPENAFDGDLSTSWQFGDFGSAVGQHLRIVFDRPRAPGVVRIAAAALGPVQIDRLRLRAGSRTQEVALANDGTASADLGDRPVRSVTLLVAATRGDGFNRVGLAEVGLGALQLRRVAQLPDTFTRLLADLGGDGMAALAQTPLDVVMTRERGTDLTTDDEEPRLDRDFSLPDDRTFRAYGLVRPGRGITDAQLDEVAGTDGRVTVTSSSRAFDLPELRGSQALDGDPATAWIPGGDSVGESLVVRAPPQPVSSVSVSQEVPGGQLTGWATKVRVQVGRGDPVEAAVGPGTTAVPVPPTTAGRLRVTVLEANAPGAIVHISEVGFGTARAVRDPERAARACVTVGTLDGAPLQVHLTAQPQGNAPILVGQCRDGTVSLAAGKHSLRGEVSWVPDLFVLRDRCGESVVGPGPVPKVRVTTSFGPHYEVAADASPVPWLLVVGQSHDPLWSATGPGGGLGTSTAVDGYANGWVVPARRTGTFQVGVSSQPYTTAALVVSALGVLLLLVRVLLPGRREPAPPPRAPARGRTGPRRREPWAWAAVVLLAFLCLGVWGLGAALVVAAWHAVDRPRVRDVAVLAVGLLAAVPVAWVAGNASRWGAVSADLVLDNPWPHRLAGAGLLVLLVAVARSGESLAGGVAEEGRAA